MLFKDMLKYRNSWLGFAMIWIMFFHAGFGVPVFLTPFKIFGYGGVDICLFASGIGCYYSLTKNSDVGDFIKRRFSRLAPTYLCFIVFWLVYKAFADGITLPVVVGNVFAIQCLTGLEDDFNWYISAILLFYFLAPYLKILVDKTNNAQKLLILIVFIALSVPFWTANSFIIIITRLPIFYIGMIFAKKSIEGQKLSKQNGLILGISFCIGIFTLAFSALFLRDILWSHGFWWYPFIFLTPGLCVILTYIMSFIEKNKILSKIKKVIDLIGRYSFEFYLVHILMFDIIEACITKFNLQKYSYLCWTVGIIVVSVGCILLKKLTDCVIKLLDRVSKQEVKTQN